MSARLAELDAGRRCEAHVGEVFPPRCIYCEVAAAIPVPDRDEGARLDALFARTGYIPGSECSLHANYPLPCDSCKRDRTYAADLDCRRSGD